MSDAVDAITADRALVLMIEDLHWSDHPTLDLIGWLARRRDPARLFVLGTYRPVDATVRAHPLRRWFWSWSGIDSARSCRSSR